MIKRFCGLLAAIQFTGVGLALAQTHPPAKQQPHAILAGATQVSTDDTRAAIAVSPRSLEFASIAVGRTRSLTFNVRNVGTGLLTGTAKVPAPFRIVSGSPYALAGSQSQDIVVQYVPRQAGMHVAVVQLTGGGSGRLTVSGSAVPARPTPRQKLRLLAENR